MSRKRKKKNLSKNIQPLPQIRTPETKKPDMASESSEDLEMMIDAVNIKQNSHRRTFRASVILAIGLSAIGLAIRSALKDTRQKINKSVENTNWFEKTPLPQVELDKERKVLSENQINSYFISESIHSERIRQFYVLYDQKKQELFLDLMKTQDRIVRSKKIIMFLDFVCKAYFWITETPRKTMSLGSEEMTKTLYELNKILIPHKEWITSINDGEFSLIFYDVDGITNASVTAGSNSYQVPIVSLSGRHVVSPSGTDKNTLKIGGLYTDIGRYVVLDNEASIEEGKNCKKKLDGFIGATHSSNAEINDKGIADNVLRHELMHFVFDVVHGVNRGSGNVIINKGDIRMHSGEGKHSEYVLKNASYSWPNNFQLHELAAVGFSLKNSGDLALFSSFSIIGSGAKNYQFAGVILFYELLNSPYTKDDTKAMIDNALSGKSVSHKELAKALSEIPNDELHHMGERMVKLAIFLTQKK